MALFLPRLRCVALACAFLVSVAPVMAATSGPLTFEKDIQPLLQARCLKCHSGEAAQGKLDLRTTESLLKGGVSGPALVPGSPDKSLIFRVLVEGRMPPAGNDPLTRSERDTIQKWIAAGAFSDASRARAHWAFVPPRRPAIPTTHTGAKNPIDAFLFADHKAKGNMHVTEANRVTLLRRATYDLIGLPPTPAEIDAFVTDRTPDAYERVIDRLLASPRYGERWGRHWLDAAGYADSEGVLEEDRIRTNAYRYRDYVIESFNEDRPYDRFLREQIAGDELVEYRNAKQFTPDITRPLIATGFLRTAVDATREDFQPSDYAEYLWRTVFDTEHIVSTAILGLTMNCAQCHDHKYEPLTQRDYYRFQAIFAGALRPTGPVLPTYKRLIVEAPADEQKRAQEVNGRVDAAVKTLTEKQAALVNEYKAKHPKGQAANDAELRQSFPEYAARADTLNREKQTEESKRITLPTIRALYDLDSSPPPTRILRRGDPTQPGDPVDPGVPEVLKATTVSYEVTSPSKDAATTGRRRALAAWLTQSNHPLTARVMANRIWAHHFGEGLVPTMNNFGVSGAPPSNQPLLDFLATEFVRQNWSVKAMHRLIMTSEAYLRGGMHPRRLEAEIVRDALLAVAGTLDDSMYGEPVATEAKATGEVVAAGETGKGRRSVYQLVRRSRPQSILQVFDAPVMEVNCTRRSSSTTVAQSLALLNSDFVTAQAGHFARRVLKECPPIGEDHKASIAWAFRLAFARPPTGTELAGASAFIRRQVSMHRVKSSGEAVVRAYADLCQALLSANEFLYLD